MRIDMTQFKNQSALVELLVTLINNKNVHMSTLDLLETGILSPASGIARLKDRGVVFETIYKSIEDRNGMPRKGVAHYKIVGGVVL